ncbi:DNA-binding protein [Natronococcus pandeyae]|uniref:DNA-binding protein n=1 Tax=Natronococcus pandeyae TaxID=2055836 RepID=A0A8J8TPC1_9EURY|nr:DNA-binding protein [Natronococcus pandeyae]TYL37268.1 DNA-binding protein [Natronococcus pandeyae]
MSSTNFRENKASDESSVNQEAAAEKTDGDVEVEDPFTEDIVDEALEFSPSVEQETHTKVETNHPETVVGREENEFGHLPLAQEERIRAREEELELISAKATVGRQDGREKRTREVVVEQRRERRVERVDPRSELEQERLAEVNRQSVRITKTVRGGPNRAAVSRGLAEKVIDGTSMIDATLEEMDEVKAESGTIVDIADVPEVEAGEVDVEGEIIELWEPSKSSISQVGLIADDTGKMKFTIWKNSYQTTVSEGETVRIRNAAKNWHNERCNLAVTGWSRLEFPERGRWWTQE